MHFLFVSSHKRIWDAILFSSLNVDRWTSSFFSVQVWHMLGRFFSFHTSMRSTFFDRDRWMKPTLFFFRQHDQEQQIGCHRRRKITVSAHHYVALDKAKRRNLDHRQVIIRQIAKKRSSWLWAMSLRLSYEEMPRIKDRYSAPLWHELDADEYKSSIYASTEVSLIAHSCVKHWDHSPAVTLLEEPHRLPARMCLKSRLCGQIIQQSSVLSPNHEESPAGLRPYKPDISLDRIIDE